MKKRILLAYLAYPFAIASYFRHALEKRSDVELTTCGIFTGDYIPWAGGMRIPMRYVKNVDLKLPQSINSPSWEEISRKLNKDFDLVFNVDAGFHFKTKPSVPYAVIATDPHVLGDWYKKVRPLADYFFNMQYFYAEPNDIVLPYACSPDHHYAMSDIKKEYDASLIGLHYNNRTQLVEALRHKGYNVLYTIGLVWDEYRIENNKATIGLNWSSLQDINARIFEIMAMKRVPVINRLPFLDKLGFYENRHYLGFDSIQEAIEKVDWVLNNPEQAEFIANNAYNLVHNNHTYELRVEEILKTVGLTVGLQTQ